MIWQSYNKSLELGNRGHIMGILNATPDSFSDGGKFLNPEAACSYALEMIADGATIIDIGGESTRPGAASISEEEELERVIPVIRSLRKSWSGWISIDTTKATVAEAALAAGADIVNDISGLEADPRMVDVCRESGCAVVVMHRQGSPETMQIAPCYNDVVEEVREYFRRRFDTLTAAGIAAEQICFDPGIGFGKTPEHNWQLLQHLDQFIVENRPLLLGASKKSIIGARLENNDMSLRTWPTVAITAHGRALGVMIHRVHEVKKNLEAMLMTEAIMMA